jgi:hypothetical protein
MGLTMPRKAKTKTPIPRFSKHGRFYSVSIWNDHRGSLTSVANNESLVVVFAQWLAYAMRTEKLLTPEELVQRMPTLVEDALARVQADLIEE